MRRRCEITKKRSAFAAKVRAMRTKCPSGEGFNASLWAFVTLCHKKSTTLQRSKPKDAEHAPTRVSFLFVRLVKMGGRRESQPVDYRIYYDEAHKGFAILGAASVEDGKPMRRALGGCGEMSSCSACCTRKAQCGNCKQSKFVHGRALSPQ